MNPRLLVVASAIFLSAASEPAAPPQPAAKSNTVDEMQRVICQKQEVLGSRLATRRVCKTRAQWAQDQLDDRQEIDKVQIRRGLQN